MTIIDKLGKGKPKVTCIPTTDIDKNLNKTNYLLGFTYGYYLTAVVPLL